MMEYVADMNMGISFSNFDLTESQQDIVKKYIEYHFIVKDEFDKSSKLNQAYLLYSKEISKLIAKSEVYGHDLPDGVFAINEYIFSLLTYSSQIKNDDKLLDITYNNIIKSEEYLINTLRLKLLNIFIELIESYRKFLRRFNYKGIPQIDSSFVVEVLSSKEKIKKLKKSKQKSNTMIKSFRKKSPNRNDLNDISIDLGAVCELSFLKDAYEDAGKILSDIEKAYPVIVSNGYNGFRFTKILKHIATALSVFLAITGCISFINFILAKI